MIVILGLLIVLAATGVAVAGVVANSGSAHVLGDSFVIFGQSVTGLSIGQLFLFGVIVGVVGMLGLAMLFGTFNRRLASRGSRRALTGSRRESAGLRLDRERLTQQLDDERSERQRLDSSRDTGVADVAEADRARLPVSVNTPDVAEADRARVPVSVNTPDDRPTMEQPVPAGHSGLWHRLSKRMDG